MNKKNIPKHHKEQKALNHGITVLTLATSKTVKNELYCHETSEVDAKERQYDERKAYSGNNLSNTNHVYHINPIFMQEFVLPHIQEQINTFAAHTITKTANTT